MPQAKFHRVHAQANRKPNFGRLACLKFAQANRKLAASMR
jgi:hypothetical protein